MQIVLQTPTEIVAHESRWGLVTMGAIFAAMGFGIMWLRWSHPTGWSGNGPFFLVYVIGGVFGIAGLAMIYFSADRRYVIDRSAKTASIIVQRLVHRQTTTVPLNDIDDVVLEESAGMARTSGNSSQTGPTFRVAFAMKDGSRVPWTPYSTSDRISQEKCAAAVRTFGGWSGHPDHAVPASITAPSLISHPVATNWGCLAAFLAIFVAAGLGIFSLQVYRIATYQPIAAQVYSTGIKTVKGSKGGNSYAPMVSYGFYYKGVAYYSTAVNPIEISASYTWANDITKQFKPGSVVTAYFNPSDPSKAFLLKHASGIPLIFVLVPVLIGLLFAWVIRVQRATAQFGELHLVPVVAAR
jgi:hypothetical protein